MDGEEEVYRLSPVPFWELGMARLSMYCFILAEERCDSIRSQKPTQS